MRPILSLVILVPLCGGLVYGGWQKTFGGSSWDAGYAALEFDDDYWIFGRYVVDGVRACALVVDEDGNLQHQYFFGPTDEFSAIFDAKIFQDSLIVVCGHAGYSYDSDLWIAAIRPDGSVKWTLRHDIDYGTDSALALDFFEDSLIFVAGVAETTYESDSPFEKCGVVLKINPDGTIATSRFFTNSENFLSINAIKVLPLGAYIIGGTMDIGGSAYRGYIAKIDADDSIIWWDTIPYPRHGIYDITTSDDANFFAVGYSVCPATYGTEVSVINFNGSGEINWTQHYSLSSRDEGYDMVLSPDGAVIIGETYGGPGYMDGKNMFLLKISASTGDSIAVDFYGGTDDDVGYGIMRDDMGNLIAVGYSCSFGETEGDIYVIKTNDVLSVKEPPLPAGYEVGAFPNPFNRSVVISLPTDAEQVVIYDAAGTKIDEFTPDGSAFRWSPPANCGSGIYFVRAHFSDTSSAEAKILYIK